MKLTKFRLRIFVAALLTAANSNSYSAAQTHSARIIGKARVIDGDTISIGGFSIWLEGIDAPEEDQTCTGAKGDIWQCGKTATQRLSGLLKDQDVTCEKSGEDRYKRTLAFCHLSDGTELNAWLVREGLALAFVRYSARYVKDEKEAKDAKRGVWAGTFQAPWDWRVDNLKSSPERATVPLGLLQKAQAQAPNSKANCPIKGNISHKGERIYHVPGSKWYEKTEIKEQDGERWFCSVAEAEAAGWRAPRNRN